MQYEIHNQEFVAIINILKPGATTWKAVNIRILSLPTIITPVNL